MKVTHFSYSKMSTYERCPQLYYLIYVRKIERKENPAFTFGSLCHKAISFFNEEESHSLDGLDECLDYAVLEVENSSSFTDSARVLLHSWFERVMHDNDFKRDHVIYNETPMEIDLGDGVTLHGVIDFAYAKDGKFYLQDYKTNKVMPSYDEMLFSDQSAIYTLMMRENLKHVPDAFVWDYVRHKRVVCPIVPDMVDAVSRKLHTTIEIIEDSKDFTANIGNACAWCEARDYCSEHLKQAGAKRRA